MQPLVEAGIEFRQGKRLTNAELKTVKSRTILQDDGSLKSRGAVEDGNVHGYIGDPVRAAKRKTWEELNRFGKFKKVAELSCLPAAEIEDAARYGNHDDKCAEINWGKIQAAIDKLSGRTARRAKQAATKERQRPRDAKRDAARYARQKLKAALTELQSADYIVFQSDTVNDECDLCFAELYAQFIRREVRKLAAKYSTCPGLHRRNGDVDLALSSAEGAAEIVKIADDVTDDMTSPVIEYWGNEARKQRVNKATAIRMARKRSVSSRAGAPKAREETRRERKEPSDFETGRVPLGADGRSRDGDWRDCDEVRHRASGIVGLRQPGATDGALIPPAP